MPEIGSGFRHLHTRSRRLCNGLDIPASLMGTNFSGTRDSSVLHTSHLGVDPAPRKQEPPAVWKDGAVRILGGRLRYYHFHPDLNTDLSPVFTSTVKDRAPLRRGSQRSPTGAFDAASSQGECQLRSRAYGVSYLCCLAGPRRCRTVGGCGVPRPGGGF